ncbi:MAG: alpha-N-acetylglucosaminidase C-terminal domain-containing protein [Faecalibacterium sp.]|nr:alpha-N-acetylglucosaminidase C-terminal domain-containing protein [Ruminococcus sp.]MCM1393240.1 alpha-N-acetylglucosaminidase C-terminal domain-containing protein [Ruminococcus sp.]MCM1486318.1 alpha-N-acetylglucosaminidase C-terminal domain-containing protein [Faecalibacterium sp.]
MSNSEITVNSSWLFANENRDNVYKAFDGNMRTKWVGGQYPGYVEIDFEKNHRIDKMIFDFAKTGYSIFSVFKSTDAVNFEQVLSQDSEQCSKGHYEFDCSFECRTIRVYIKYNSVSPYAEIRNIKLFGEELDTPLETAEVEYPTDFENSEYNVNVTVEDTISELHALIGRTIGEKYKDSFIFDIIESDEQFFELTDENGKIKITANSGVNAACGINHYFKKYCNVHISQVGNNINMPSPMPMINGTVHMKTPFEVRYSYNYCALSYTMAFWNEDDWQKELDWLALQGANVILDITAQEEVWRRFLTKLGYGSKDIKAFITGPAYYAWFCMANIYGVGGPVHDGFFKKRTDLARKNHLFMRKMGMQPVLQGYSGMVPPDIKKYVPNAAVIPQGLWNALARPYMLKTDSETYIRLAKIFYESQNEVFGNITDYYATDPFHEGGTSGRMKVENVSRQILSSMLENNPNSIWIIQSWGENPSKALVNGIADRKEHALILDLYAEKKPRWQNYLGREFLNTPWVYCMLNNFGGRMGLHGHLRTLANEIASASHNANYMRGIGITPEATHSNPIVFDLFFETMWTDKAELEPIDLDEWLKGYIKRRYGGYTDNMYRAMKMLDDTVYNPELNENGEGAPESVVNARPDKHITSASTWGNGIIAYDKKEFEKAVELFAADYDLFKDSEGYHFDLIDLLKQVLSNTAQEYQKAMEAALESKDLIEFMKWSDKYLEIIAYIDEVLSNEKEFLLGSWINKAKQLADGFDDFTMRIFEFNARAQITTWAGARDAADKGGLKDYSNKQWAGLTKDFYLMRWKKWIDSCIAELSGKDKPKIDWFRTENRWTWLENSYTDIPKQSDMKPIIKKVLEVYGV